METVMKTIVVTGAASGLGKAIAKHYHQKNWKTIIADIQDEAGQGVVNEINADGGEAHYFHCDVAKVEDFDALVKFTEDTTGQCNILANNAGVSSSGTLMDSTEAEWERLITLDLMSCVRGSKAFIPLIRKSATAESPNAIVNTASFAGIALMPRMITYNVAKAGVIAFTESLRGELKKDHIHVAAACPAFFKSNLHTNMIAATEKTLKQIEKWVTNTSLTAEIVAENIAEGIERKDILIITDKKARRYLGFLGWVYSKMFPKNWK